MYIHFEQQEGLGLFLQIFQAIQGTDVSLHTHVEIQLAYYELSLRYNKLLSQENTANIALSLVKNIQQMGGIVRSPYNELVSAALKEQKFIHRV